MKLIAKFCITMSALFVAQTAQAADVPPSYAPPPVSVETYQMPCYAMFHTLHDAEGLAVLRQGPEEIPVIRRLRFENGLPLRGRVRSVTTSPGARIELYQGRGFRRILHDVGPGSLINLRRPLRVGSYRLYCPPPVARLPMGQPPSYKRPY